MIEQHISIDTLSLKQKERLVDYYSIEIDKMKKVAEGPMENEQRYVLQNYIIYLQQSLNAIERSL